MWWNKMLYLGACLLLCLFSCNSQTDNAMVFQDAEPLQINRFDRTLLRWLEHPDDSAALDSLRSSYRPMLELTGKGILNVQSPEQEEFFPRLTNYYGEPTLRSLYRDAINSFDSTSDIEKAMGQAFAFLEGIFPERIVPTLYMHVSGFNQNILVSDSALSLSIDKYLGEDYPLYRQFFPDYERAKMTRDFASVDYLLGWLMSELPAKSTTSSPSASPAARSRISWDTTMKPPVGATRTRKCSGKPSSAASTSIRPTSPRRKNTSRTAPAPSSRTPRRAISAHG